MEAQLEATHCKVARTTPVRTNVMSPIAVAPGIAAAWAVLVARAVAVEWVVLAV
jgi:hypothetical protein